MPEFRRGGGRKLLDICDTVKTIEVHSGLTGLIAEKTVVGDRSGLDQFDAMWISSLCDSTAKGKPDIELVDMTSRIRTIDDDGCNDKADHSGRGYRRACRTFCV